MKLSHFNEVPYPYHHEIRLRIETLTNQGLGLGRDNGWVIMVPFVLPGELVKVRIYKNHKNYSEGDVIEIIEASKERVRSVCPLFEECGGCQYQHMSYAAQLQYKQQQVEEVMEKIGGLEVLVLPTISSPREYGYRSKLTPHFKRPKEGEVIKVGFLKQGSRHHLIDVEGCPIAMDGINKILPKERGKVISGERKFKKGGTLLLRETFEGVETNPKGIIEDKVGELRFQFIAGEFFQNNPFVVPRMVEYAVEKARFDGIEYFVDTYCGVGVFALSAAKYFCEVAGIEVSATAIEFAKKNAELNNIGNVSFHHGEAEKIFEHLRFRAEQTSILIDPPRKGCEGIFLEQLVNFFPKRIIYVSCDPATQARDLKFLVNSGYKVLEIQPFDLFPQTRHIESVATLERG